MSRRFHVWTLAAAVVTAVASTWPIAAHLSDHVIDGALFISPAAPHTFWAENIRADVITTVWILNWVLHALVTQPLHVFDANIFYPTPLAGARQEILFATDILGAPGALLGNPVLAHQTALLLCLVLTFWAAAYVVARWTGSLVGGIVAGILLTVSPFHQGQIFHLQSLGTAYLPLVVLGIERFGATGRPRWAALVGIALAMQTLSGQYLGYMAMVVAAVAGVVCVVAGRPDERPLRRLGRDVLWLAGAAAFAGLMTLPFAIPYFRLSQTGDIPDFSHAWTNKLYFLVRYLPWYPDQSATISLAAWLLVLGGIAALLWNGREGRVRAVMLVAIGWAGALASLGERRDVLNLWGALAAVVPGFGSMREPIRFTLVPYLAVALLGGCCAAAVVRRLPRLGTVAALLLAVAAAYHAWRGPLPLRYVPVGRDVPARPRPVWGRRSADRAPDRHGGRQLPRRRAAAHERLSLPPAPERARQLQPSLAGRRPAAGELPAHHRARARRAPPADRRPLGARALQGAPLPRHRGGLRGERGVEVVSVTCIRVGRRQGPALRPRPRADVAAARSEAPAADAEVHHRGRINGRVGADWCAVVTAVTRAGTTRPLHYRLIESSNA